MAFSWLRGSKDVFFFHSKHTQQLKYATWQQWQAHGICGSKQCIQKCINVKVFMVYKVSSVFKWHQKFYFPIAVRKSNAFVCKTVCLLKGQVIALQSGQWFLTRVCYTKRTTLWADEPAVLSQSPNIRQIICSERYLCIFQRQSFTQYLTHRWFQGS